MIVEVVQISMPNPDQYVEVNSGCMIVIPFTLQAGKYLLVTVTHAALTQDSSLRAYIGERILSKPIVTVPEALSYWHPNREGNAEIFTVADRTGGPVYAQFLIPADPGQLFLHVENLVNPVNGFFVSFVEMNI